MPNVGGKEFPYTKKGMMDAKKAKQNLAGGGTAMGVKKMKNNTMGYDKGGIVENKMGCTVVGGHEYDKG